MSMEIDTTKKFSPEVVQYLKDRDRWRELQDNAREFGGDEPALPNDLPVTGPESVKNALGPTGLTPEQQAEYRKEQEAGEEPVDYEAMTVKELKAELDGRKAEAATDEEKANLEYATKDDKPTLIARLDKDDELVASRP